MFKSAVDHQQVINALAGLRKSLTSITLLPRQFVEADLDQLATDGIFPENDFLHSFQSETEAHILPLFWKDRKAFDNIMKLNVGIFGKAFQQTIERRHFYMLWIENIHFFVYCFCIILKNGHGTNPYFGLTEGEEDALNAAFRHLVEDAPVTTTTRRMGETSALSPDDIYIRLRHRGFLRPDGSLNRNAMKNAFVELGWIYRSDFCNDVAEKIKVVDSLSHAERIACGETYLNHYLTVLLMQYLGITHASQHWFIDSLYPILEEFLSRCESKQKRSRHELRVAFTDVVANVSRGTGKPVETVVFLLARSLAEPQEFRRFIGAKSMTDAMYYGTLVCEFARDVYPLAAD